MTEVVLRVSGSATASLDAVLLTVDRFAYLQNSARAFRSFPDVGADG